MKERMFIAIYLDLENVSEKLDLSILLDSISLKIEEDLSSIFAIKLACGNDNSISKFRNQLRDLNFEIREAPHVSDKNLKNRADLILTVEAFETLYKKEPNIDLYVFITSDTDFTVIMDKLRKYGKKVWLVTRNVDKNRKLFNSCSDHVLVIEEYENKDEDKQIKTKIPTFERKLTEKGFTKAESKALINILESFEKDKWYHHSSFGTKIRNTIKDFSYKGKLINSQTKLFEFFLEEKYIESKKIDTTNSFKVIK